MATSKDIIQQNLDRFGYDYVQNGQGFEVKLGFNLRMTIDLSQDSRVLLRDRLQGWNLLTGLVPTKDLSRAVRHTWILNGIVFLFAIFLLSATIEGPRTTLLHVILVQLIVMVNVVWTLSATIFYLVKAEGFRQTVMAWMKD